MQAIAQIRTDWTIWGITKTTIYLGCLAIYNFCLGTLNYIEVKKEIVLALAIAMVFDTITGVIKAYVLGKTDPKIKVTSREGKKGVLEKTLMLLGVVLLGVIGKLLGVDLSWLVVNSLILLTVFESFSFFGNILSIRTGKQTEELDAISGIIKFVRNGLKTVIEKFLDSKPKDEETT